jgi:uncharacterized protein
VKSKLLSDQEQKVYAVIFDKGDEFKEGLTEFAKQNRLSASQITAVGAFSDVTLGYFDRNQMEYKRIPVKEQVEVLSLVGDIVLSEGEPEVHAHVVLGRADATTLGGHIMEAHVWPTLEVIVSESPKHLHKEHDAETGLTLISA